MRFNVILLGLVAIVCGCGETIPTGPDGDGGSTSSTASGPGGGGVGAGSEGGASTSGTPCVLDESKLDNCQLQ